MAEYKCNGDMHKFGPYIKDSVNSIFRKCSCCGSKSFYPDDDDIKRQIKSQEDAINLLGVLLDNNTGVIQSSDDFMKLVACLFDHLSYLFITKETQTLFMDKLRVFNSFFNSNELERTQLINNLNEYLKLYFEKENIESRFGLNSFPEEGYQELDSMFISISKKIDMEMTDLFNKENEKNHLARR